MGASASSLPDKLSEEDCKGLFKEQYDAAVFGKMMDSEGFVTKEQLMQHLAGSSEEKEVENVFATFCPKGGMDSRTFLKFCKDSKLLKKNCFTSTDCDLTFEKAKKHQGTTSKEISFVTFRKFVVPIIAEKRGESEAKLIAKLARAEGPVLHGTQAEAVRFHDDQSTFTGSHAQGGPSIGKNDTGGVQMENLLDRKEGDVRGRAVEEDPEEAAKHKAALKLQNASRAKVAMKKVHSMKEV